MSKIALVAIITLILGIAGNCLTNNIQKLSPEIKEPILVILIIVLCITIITLLPEKYS